MSKAASRPKVSRDPVVGTQSLDRGLSLLLTIGSSPAPGMSLSECSSALELSKATTQRMLQTLVRRGFLVTDQETGLYTLGPTTVRLGTEYLRRIDVRRYALPYMRSLMSSTQETVHLGVLRGTNVVYIELVESNVPVRIFSQIGESAPAYATAIGKAILATLPTPRVFEHLPEVLKPRTPQTITSVDALMADLRSTRERGFASDLKENRENVRGYAAAILDHKGDAIAAIAVAGPSDRITESIEKKMTTEVVRAARMISLEIGAEV